MRKKEVLCRGEVTGEMKWHFSGKQDVYLEVAERYARYIREGVLRPGEGLPSVRAVAEELGINPHTVSKAYGVLEEQGYLQIIPKKGAYVCGKEQGASWNIQDEQEEDLKKVKELLCILRTKGLPKEQALALIKEVYDQ